MHVAITGGTGFVGRALTDSLSNDGHTVSILTRHPGDNPAKTGVTYTPWLTAKHPSPSLAEPVDAIVNLAGESINSGRWTAKRKRHILDSRMTATANVIEMIKNAHQKPKVLINASAVGYYGMSESNTFNEASEINSDDFLANVVRRWEDEAAQAQAYDVRAVFTRFGVILGDQGVLPLMTLPYKMGIGGTIGSGKQWLSWVHIADVIGMIRFAIDTPEVTGPLNVTAPEPERMKPFGQTVSQVMHRPHWLPVPAFAMKTALGEMSQLLLQGQRVLPQKAEDMGYTFQYPQLKPALQQLLSQK